MVNHFDIDIANGSSTTGYRVVIEDDYGDLGCCYLLYENGREIGSICRLADGKYRAIDYTQLTQTQIDNIGWHIGNQLVNGAL
ncbi:hypothetical protein [Mucilaginibacter lacusdianchii]|uniref:hypothetical protein n=1 Tax=Mucilaginibacter lacusdianchii TaxID=2684211 RepID=UPI00131AD74F|nr:hypothetical protein [Mucilaginibacter sp. JXJ CY 39]